jgi:hypothetical protein
MIFLFFLLLGFFVCIPMNSDQVLAKKYARLTGPSINDVTKISMHYISALGCPNSSDTRSPQNTFKKALKPSCDIFLNHCGFICGRPNLEAVKVHNGDVQN